MSGVKRVNAALGMYAASSEAAVGDDIDPERWWARRADREQAGLVVRARYKDTRCFLRGNVLQVESAALTGVVLLPARIHTKAPAIDRLSVREDLVGDAFVCHLTHPVLKHVLEPWLSQADLAALSKAVDDIPYAVAQSVYGRVYHECRAMNRRCVCKEFRCEAHHTWNVISGKDCTCMDHKRVAEDAEAVFYNDNGELHINSVSFPEVWVIVTLPLRLVPRGRNGVLVLERVNA